MPEDGWDYENCSAIRYKGDDTGLKGTEDITHYKDEMYFVSTGLYGGIVDDSNYDLGGIYTLDVSTTPPSFERSEIYNMPAGSNFRPHGFDLDHDSNRLFVVSHNEQYSEENIVIFTIDGTTTPPSFVFEVALFSSDWIPIGSRSEAYHLNDVVYAGDGEILTTQLGPMTPPADGNPNVPNPNPRYLYSCQIPSNIESKILADGRLETICKPALNLPTTYGLNGVTIDDDKTTVWTSDVFHSQLLKIVKDKGEPPIIPENVAFERDVGVNFGWKLQNTIPTPGVVDNVEYMDGKLYMGFNGRTEGILSGSTLPWVGGFLVGEELVAVGQGGSQDFSLGVRLQVGFQFTRNFLEKLGDPFGTSSAIPVGSDGQYLVLGSYDFPGLVLCDKNVMKEDSLSDEDVSSGEEDTLSKDTATMKMSLKQLLVAGMVTFATALVMTLC